MGAPASAETWIHIEMNYVHYALLCGAKASNCTEVPEGEKHGFREGLDQGCTTNRLEIKTVKSTNTHRNEPGSLLFQGSRKPGVCVSDPASSLLREC